MMAEVIARAIDAREQMLATGSAEKRPSEHTGSVGRPGGFNSALGSVVGAFSLGFAPNKPGPREMMSQLRLAGAAPEVGECHFACPSDCFPWSSTDGMFVVGDEVPEEDCESMCSTLAREWAGLGDSFLRGELPRYARGIPGCPVRVSLGGVGGNRVLVLTPEPASWEMRVAATSNHRNVRLASLAAADMFNAQVEYLAQRAKQPAPGGNFVAYSSKKSYQRELPPMWSPRTIRARGVGPPANGSVAEEKLGQIL